MFEQDKKQVIVDAIDDGRIVRVSEDFAIREGLPILRRKEVSFVDNPSRKNSIEVQRGEMKRASLFETFRRPLRTKKNDILSTLLDNFHWILSQKRKSLNLNRRQVADKIGAGELDVKMIENGVLPAEDYVLITKLEQLYGITIRKDSSIGRASLGTIDTSKKVETENSIKVRRDFRTVMRKKEEDKKSNNPLVGNDIEIDFDDKF
jgi:ribosome-binding protein aMBF1 (putative translation factor)